jgi:hypothetical protein
VAVGLMIANYAAIDQLDAKAAITIVNHYGTRDAMLEAGKKRNDLRKVVASKLARDVISKYAVQLSVTPSELAALTGARCGVRF